MLGDGPASQVSIELCQSGGQVVRIEAARIGKNPRVTAAEENLLESNAGVFDAGHNAIGTDPDEGDDGGAPTVHFGFEALGSGAKFVVCKFIGTRGCAFDDVCDAEIQIE